MMLGAYEQDLTVSVVAKEVTCSCAPSGKSGQLAESQPERHSPLKAPGMWSTFSITPSLRLLPDEGTEPGHQKQRRNFRAEGLALLRKSTAEPGAQCTGRPASGGR